MKRKSRWSKPINILSLLKARVFCTFKSLVNTANAGLKFLSSRTQWTCPKLLQRLKWKNLFLGLKAGLREYKKPLQRYGFVSLVLVLMISIVVFQSPKYDLRAQNYDKTWTSTADFAAGTNSNIDTNSDQAKLATTTTESTEDFTTSANKDAATDANWDTASHKLALPGDPANGIATDIQSKWKSATGANEDIAATTVDTVNGVIYYGGANGSFSAYKIATSTVYNLTSNISADWSTNSFYSLAIDTTNSVLYMAGNTARLGAYTLSATPSGGSWTYLNSKITSDWSTLSVNALIFDPVNNYMYVGGGTVRFGALAVNATPSSDTWVYLNSLISGSWGSSTVWSLVLDSVNHFIYIGGTGGGLCGAITATSNPATATFTSLTSKMAVFGANGIRTMTFDSLNGIVYLAGDTTSVEAFIGGADPANGTVTHLQNLLWYGGWGLNYIYSIAYDATNQAIYFAGNGGRFAAITALANPANNVLSYLATKISTDWGANNLTSLTFNSANGLVYLGGVGGRFGSYSGTANPANGTWANMTSNVAGGLVGYNILASTTDTANGILYLGGASGKFAAMKISDGTSYDLTSKISTNWSTNAINALTFDSTYSKIYLGGAAAKFGVYTGGSDPANGVWVYLTTQLVTPDFDNASYWSTNSINALTFDSTNGYVYFAGASTRFGVLQASTNPSLTSAWTYLTTQLTGPVDFDTSGWGSNAIYALSYDSINGYIYLGGYGTGFGAMQATSNPGNITTWAYLTSKIESGWSSSGIVTSVTFDSANNKVYIAGQSGKFGVFTGGSNPATGTYAHLSSKISANWSTDYIYSLSFAAGKIFIAGALGKFGVFTGGSDPANGAWSYLYPNVSSINGASQINTLIYNSSVATVYVGSASGKFTAFMIGYTSNKNGLSIKLNSTSQKIFKATLTATETKPVNTEILYYLSNDGGANWNAVSSGSEYTFSTATSDLRWKANLTTTNLAITPEITGLSVSYKYLAANSGSMNLAFDAAQAVTATLLSWVSILPTNTTLTYKLRSATTLGGLAVATWSDTKSNADTPVNLKTINVGGISGVPENQWYELQVDFATSDGMDTPVLSDITLQYVINQPPQIQNVVASQATNGSMTVNISYEIKDPDSGFNPYNINQVGISLKYSIDNGANYLDCTTTTGTGLKTVNQDTFAPYTATWNVGVDLANVYYANLAKIKVIANDNEQAHNTAELASSAFTLDTKVPVPGAIAGGFTGIKVGTGANWTNDTTPDLILAAADDTTVQMEIRNDNSFTGVKEAYATTKSGWELTAGDGTKNIYVRFYDVAGNYADATASVLLDTTAPAVPAHFTLFDTSSVNLGTYTITSIWDPINNPSDFEKYSLERSTNGVDFTEIASFANLASDVYADKGLSNQTTYSYRLRSRDIHENYSAFTEIKELQPAGTDTVAPEITGPGPTSQAFATTTNVTWITSEPSDSYVEFGTTVSYGTNQGTDELVANHSVTIVGLQPTTTYHYRVKSRDSSGNRVTSADYTFTTTLPEDSAEGLNITGATAQKPGADPEEATIIWTTDKYATSQVVYGKDESMTQSTVEDAVLNKTHYVTVTGLEPNTKYYYQPKSIDTYGNVVLGEMKYFVTTQTGLGTPVINYVEATDITMNSAIISWESSTVTTSVVEIGTTEGYSGRIEDISVGSTTKHVIRAKELTEGTEYHFRVMGQNADGRWVASDNYKFATIAVPRISDISVKNITSTTATVSWKTNVVTDSNVDYGVGNTDLSQGSGAIATDHEINLVSLKPATKYSYALRVRDNFGNSVTSSTMNFQTIVDTTPPVIKDMKSDVSIVTDPDGNSKAQVIVSWSTDEPATGQVKYALGVAAANDYPLSTTEDTNLTTSHIVIISNLSTSATYHLKLVSEDASSNIAVSDDYSVITLNQQKTLLEYIVQILQNRFSWLSNLGLFQ